jgi:uncharacterized iron-regulated membrane protein
MATPRFTAVLRWLHRWVGLTVGLLFAIVSLSGSLLYFQPQFFALAYGDKIPAGITDEVGSVDAWVDNARQALPGLHGPIAIWMPHVEHNKTNAAMLIFDGQPPGGLGNMGFSAALVAPATGEVLTTFDVDRSLAYAPLFLHRDLLAGATGRVVSFVMAVGTIFLLAAGLYLWWPPRTRLLAKKLSPRPWWKLTQASPLHDWVGVWTLLVLLVLSVSGLYLVQPFWMAPVIEAVAGPEAEAPAADAPCGTPIGFDEAVARASALAPATRFQAMYPVDATGAHWEVALAPPDTTAGPSQTHVAVDMACGHVQVEATPETRTAHERTELWLIGLHDGTVFGRLGEIAVSIAGLAPVILAWSGVSMWLRKRGKGR